MERPNRTKVKVVMFGLIGTVGGPTAFLAFPTQGMNPLAWAALVIAVGGIALWLITWTAIHAVSVVHSIRSTPTEVN